ncbi:ABC transporter substrate-binding protein [Planctomycetaceae bacterium SCGC AG-212-D15]|nr:ABC transporter substrate-binding protein [Planctomycetaceae bacterium SCGC AG-212-D15]
MVRAMNVAMKIGCVCLLAILMAGCGAAPGSDSGKLTVGFVYVGPRDDYGYNQAHAEGAAALKTRSDVRVFEEERVPDTADCQKTVQSMIEIDGARAIFATSFNYYDPHVLKLARLYPDVTFLHCGGLWDEKQHPANVSTYFGYIDESVYLSGIVAGHATKTKKLGFVAGKPIPQVLRNINAFTLGARTVDPKIDCLLIYTGDWSKPVAEAEAANSLIDQGADVITCHVNSPKVVIEAAERRGAYSCGYHCNQSALAPKGYLTGAEWNWEKVYRDYVDELKAGHRPANFKRGGLKEGVVKSSPYGPAVSAEAKEAAEAARERLLAGNFAIFKGPLKDSAGKEVIPAGKAYPQNAIELEAMDYLVEGVLAK